MLERARSSFQKFKRDIFPFSGKELSKLTAVREKFASQPAEVLDSARAEFARWLFEQGTISEQIAQDFVQTPPLRELQSAEVREVVRVVIPRKFRKLFDSSPAALQQNLLDLRARVIQREGVDMHDETRRRKRRNKISKIDPQKLKEAGWPILLVLDWMLYEKTAGGKWVTPDFE